MGFQDDNRDGLIDASGSKNFALHGKADAMYSDDRAWEIMP